MNLPANAEVLFREKQHFRQIWVWVLLFAIAGVSIYSAVQQLIIGEPFGNNPAPDVAVLFIAIFFGIGFPLFYYYVNMTTEVRPDGVYYRFFPFHWSFRRIGPDEILNYEARQYNPVREYGGWGMRNGGSGRALTVSGRMGVQFYFTDGKRLLLGSRRPDEMVAAIKQAFHK